MSGWHETPTLEGRHVTLRALDHGDLDALVAAAREDDLWDRFYANVSQLKSPAIWWEAGQTQQEAGRARLFAVLDREGEVVGTTRLMRMSEKDRRLEIGGTFYATRVQRTGLNTEAKRMLLGHAFDTLGCQCVQFRTDALNLDSQRAIERLGARRDGMLRGHQVMADGRIRDSILYSVIDREWPGVRARLDLLLKR